MQKQRIAGLGSPLPDHRPVAEARTIISIQNPSEARLLARPKIVGRIDMKRAAAFIGLGLGSGLYLHRVCSLACNTVGVCHDKVALVFSTWLEVEDRAGEALRDGVIEVLSAPVHVLTTDANERESIAPSGISNLPELNRDCGIAIYVARNGPFKAQVQKCRMFDVEFASLSCILSQSTRGQQQEVQRSGSHSWGHYIFNFERH
jgi:hypothetical protein